MSPDSSIHCRSKVINGCVRVDHRTANVPVPHKRLGFVKNAIQDQLAERDYIVGNAFSAADVMLGFFCHLATVIGQLDDSHPKVCAYYSQLAERPAFQKAKSS